MSIVRLNNFEKETNILLFIKANNKQCLLYSPNFTNCKVFQYLVQLYREPKKYCRYKNNTFWTPYRSPGFKNLTMKKILIVDDDLSQLDIIEILFENSGFEVDQAIDAQNALSKVTDFSPDIILLDLNMPNVNGAEAAKKIRELKYSGPILAFTASEDQNLIDKALENGCKKVLRKPCCTEILVNEVSSLL